jgi:hypothetical protein
MYPIIEITVEIMNAFFLPNLFAKKVTTGITKTDVTTAPIIENNAGTVPAAS